ncbi:helix-turn-helix domain-containing protein [Dyella jejuensis]|uniref:helix-turn-helix domain-containing protein n=1 Tax=Dyella jejuensis TaxID=1432009 RepID=UPI00384B270A
MAVERKHERYQIQHLHRGGFSLREIGDELQRAPSTIRRELGRDTQGVERYDARQAHRRTFRAMCGLSSRPVSPKA